mmetsp:Transcript_48664/g.129051  ORF Transcript_48664/g.129051 Transcript_48664/m.129051 type:complete len:93 (-) Transcript_48664:221-499(-)
MKTYKPMIEFAKSMMPKFAGAWLQPYTEKCKFQAYYTTPSSPRRQTFHYVETSTESTVAVTLRLCLRWAWRHHTTATKESCPYNINAALSFT